MNIELLHKLGSIEHPGTRLTSIICGSLVNGTTTKESTSFRFIEAIEPGSIPLFVIEYITQSSWHKTIVTDGENYCQVGYLGAYVYQSSYIAPATPSKSQVHKMIADYVHLKTAGGGE